MVLLAGTVVAQGQGETPVVDALPGGLDALIASLGDPSFEVREAASRAIATGASHDLDTIIEAAAASGLSPEQRSRLIASARARFIASSPPALGVRFNDANRSEVELGEIFEGFNAREMLAPGDVITAVHGERVQGWDDVRTGIMSHVPGETIALTVLRRDDAGATATFDVAVELGLYNSLPGQQTVPDIQRLEAFESRLRRGNASADTGLAEVASLPLTAWLAAEGLWPPPAGNVPVGGLGLRGGTGPAMARSIAPGGQPWLDATPESLTRSDLTLRQRRESRNIGIRAGMPAWWESLAAYRISMLNLVEIDTAFFSEGGTSSRRFNTAGKLDTLQRRRAQVLDEIGLFAEDVRAIDAGDENDTDGADSDAGTGAPFIITPGQP
jgi:hypothetical protein